MPVIVAQRGRGLENPSDRTTGNPNLKQTLEANKDGISNSITTVQKDNLVLYAGGDKKPPTSCLRAGRTCEVGTNNGAIRRLTPVECERLMGMPDNWTKYGNFDGEVKEISDTQRYKMCGNSLTPNVVTEKGKRLYKKQDN